MLLDYFGLWYRALTAGSAGSAKGAARQARIVVVEYAGQQYRVPIEQIASFLEGLREPKKVARYSRKRIRKGKKAQFAPQVKLVDAPPEEVAVIETAIDKTNEIIQSIWASLIQRKLLERDDDEAILLLVMNT